MSTTIVNMLSVWCPEWEHFEFVGVLLNVRHLVLHHIIGNKVTLRIVDFNLIRIVDVEVLACGVRRIDYQWQFRMPGRIDTSREDRVIAHIDFANLSIIGNDGTTMILTSMELHTLWVILLIIMTVDTLSVSILCT